MQLWSLLLLIAALTYGMANAPARAQGFAGLGTEAEGFQIPAPNPRFDFPTDHGAHPDYRIEWWYLTATLEGADGRDYGAQWTLFRSALAPVTSSDWTAPQIYLGHAGVTTPDSHFSAERFGRGGIGQAGVSSVPFRAFVDDWEMRSTVQAGDALGGLDLRARGADFAYDLALQAEGPLIFHGQGGYSVKSPEGQASYYYSQPFYSVTGTLDLPDGSVEVSGTAWLDREWSSQPLSDGQEGWDWVSLQFEDGARMMGFGLRDRAGAVFTSATWIAPDGQTTSYGDGALRMTATEMTQIAGRRVPTAWRIELPDRGLNIQTRALNPHSWMAVSIPYWEGPIFFDGTHQGRGYLEMTGYEQRP